MIIGGAKVYQELLEYSNKLLLTEIDAEEETADAYFPNFQKEEWDQKVLGVQEEKGTSFKHLVYTRKK